MVVPKAMCSLPSGLFAPIPTLPPDSTRIRSAPLVLITQSLASVVPIKCVPAVVPVFPVKLHAAGVFTLLVKKGIQFGEPGVPWL